MEKTVSYSHKFIREFLGLFLFFWAVLLFLALISFDATDASFNLVKSDSSEVKNMAGLFGSYSSGFLNDFFGVGSFIWPALFAGLGWSYISDRYIIFWWRWFGLFLLTLCLLTAASAFDFTIGDLTGGGMVGNTLYVSGARYLSPIGTFLVWLFLFLTGIQLLFNFSWTGIFHLCKSWLLQKLASKPVASSQNLPRPGKDVSPGGIFKKVAEKLPDFKAGWNGAPANNEAANNGEAKKGFLDKLKKLVPHVSMPALPDGTKFKNFAERTAQTLKSCWPLWKKKKAPPLEEPVIEPAISQSPPQENVPGQALEGVRLVAPDSPITPTVLEIAEKRKPHVEERQSAPQAADLRIFNPPVPESTELAKDNFPLPSPQLLVPPTPMPQAAMEDYENRGRDLMACFKDFKIQGELVRITPGPVITMYEVRPAPGVRVNSIINLSDDLSLALKALAIRIQTVPGSNTIGIEIPNVNREIVNFRDLVESPQFQNSTGALTLILGKNISGQPYMADLSKMPHLLVGGTTGAGKSVSLNAMLISLLYKLQPDELKLLLIDPKRVEMAVYADLPHLVHPVVTEMSDARTALEWAIHEMQSRFDTIGQLGVRSVAAYNQRLASFGNRPPEIFAHLKPIPYLVIVIDELADLMMTAAKEVESSIQRLLQLARAAAIHLILATQRPSVDVVTGLLKANLNCRVAFQVISRPDSRTILDQTGAEQLLGKGDMLFKPPAGPLQRLHAPFLSDDEIQTVVNYWKQQKAPSYDINFAKWSPENNGAPGGEGGGEASSDALYAEARAFVLEQGRASISLLQRKLKIGFNRAARLMEQFEKDGIISPPDGSKPRTVIKN